MSDGGDGRPAPLAVVVVVVLGWLQWRPSDPRTEVRGRRGDLEDL